MSRCTQSGTGTLIVSVHGDHGKPIGQANVAVDRVGVLGITDSSGAARIVLTTGSHALEVKRIGYRAESLSVSVVRDSSTTVNVRLHSLAQMLDSVAVGAQGVPDFLRAFDRRRTSTAHGVFLTGPQLDSMKSRSLGEVLMSRASGAKLVSGAGGTGDYIASTRPRATGGALQSCRGGSRCASSDSARVCYSTVYADGHRIFSMSSNPADPGQPPFNVREVSVGQLAAVEFYSSETTTPIEFRDGNSLCGVLAIWYRR